jgi:hypothetical protein
MKSQLYSMSMLLILSFFAHSAKAAEDGVLCTPTVISVLDHTMTKGTIASSRPDLAKAQVSSSIEFSYPVEALWNNKDNYCRFSQEGVDAAGKYQGTIRFLDDNGENITVVHLACDQEINLLSLLVMPACVATVDGI